MSTVPKPSVRKESDYLLSRSASEIRQSPLRDVMGLIHRVGALSFAHGLPAQELLPAPLLSRLVPDLLEAAPEHLQYGIPLESLKTHVVDLMAQRGVTCSADQVVLTTGAQQGLSLLSQLLLEPGRPVILEETVYDGAQMAMRFLQPDVRTVPTDLHEGLDLDAVEAAMAREPKPAFLYVIPVGHNPLGVSLSRAKRERLVELARRYEVPLVEDDAYGFLTYGDDPQPALRSLDDRWVFYVGSFSKILAPGLRVGWTVVPREIAQLLAALKHGMDLDTHNLAQGMVVRFLESGGFPLHLRRAREEYRARRDAMLSALDRELGGTDVRWNRPRAGMFVWMELPEPRDVLALLRVAIEEEGVGFSPGRAFTVDHTPDADRTLRLAFSSRSVSEIEDGMERLARAFRRCGVV